MKQTPKYTYRPIGVYFMADETNGWDDQSWTVYCWVDSNGNPLEEIKPIRPTQHPVDTQRRLSFQ